jgi:hypothetical protein
MRLLNVNSKTLEDFVDVEVPQYAILSHCWGKDEITFQDIKQPGWEDKAGSFKINFACEQAKQDGYHYIWIDTCAIDKSSSAELSEAINSMYAWYAKSAVCYAYLDDVAIAPDIKLLGPLTPYHLQTEDIEAHSGCNGSSISSKSVQSR